VQRQGWASVLECYQGRGQATWYIVCFHAAASAAAENKEAGPVRGVGRAQRTRTHAALVATRVSQVRAPTRRRVPSAAESWGALPPRLRARSLTVAGAGRTGL
jgi:hypothetical protein